MVGDGHQPNSRSLYSHDKDSQRLLTLAQMMTSGLELIKTRSIQLVIGNRWKIADMLVIDICVSTKSWYLRVRLPVYPKHVRHPRSLRRRKIISTTPTPITSITIAPWPVTKPVTTTATAWASAKYPHLSRAVHDGTMPKPPCRAFAIGGWRCPSWRGCLWTAEGDSFQLLWQGLLLKSNSRPRDHQRNCVSISRKKTSPQVKLPAWVSKQYTFRG